MKNFNTTRFPVAFLAFSVNGYFLNASFFVTRPFLFSLRKVVDFVIEEHFPELSKKTDKYLVREQ